MPNTNFGEPAMRHLPLFVALAATGLLPAASLHAANPATAAEVGRVAEQLLHTSYRADGPGAAVLVVRGEQVLYRGAFGEGDVAGNVALSADDTFRIGSITKQFAAAAVLKLVEQGKVGLDDPLRQYVKDYPNGARITVRQLLDHTSGVKSYTSIPGVLDGPIQRDVTTAQLIDSFKHEQPDFAPGEAWAYNNSGYVLVGAVIEAASGMPWHRYLDTTFFQPLGMTRTGYGADPAVVAKQVRGYSLEGDKVVDAKPISMTQPHAAGALVSSVDDLHKWNRALHEGKVLSAASYALMTTPAGKAVEAKYGFGLFTGSVRGRPELEHGGGIFGFSTMLSYVPGADVSVVVLQNADGARGHHDGPSEIARRLSAVALGDPYPAPTPIAVDAATLKQAEGVYRVDASASRVLRVVDGALTGQRTGGQRSTLIPIAQDTYLYDDGFNRFTLERDAQGRVTGMRFFAMGEGEGVVAKLTGEPLPDPRAAVALPRAALERVTGRYVGNGAPFKVFLDGETLKVQLASQPAFELKAESASKFFVTAVDATVEFTPVEGQPQAAILRQGAATIEFKRSAE